MFLTAYGNDEAGRLRHERAQLSLSKLSDHRYDFAKALKAAEGKSFSTRRGGPQKGDVHHVDVMSARKGFRRSLREKPRRRMGVCGITAGRQLFAPPAKSASSRNVIKGWLRQRISFPPKIQN